MSQMDKAVEAIMKLFSQRDDVLFELKQDKELFQAANAFKLAIIDFKRREHIKLEEKREKEAEGRALQLTLNELKIVDVVKEDSPSSRNTKYHATSKKIKPQPKITVSTFAIEIGVPVMTLLDQFACAGIAKNGPEDMLSEKDKSSLLEFLRQSHGAESHKQKITPPPMQSENIPAQSCCKSSDSDKIAQGTVSLDTTDKSTLAHTSYSPATNSAPVRSIDYNWLGKFKPFAHQIKTTEFLAHHEKAFCLNDMGTGKTLSVLWAYDYLRGIGKVQSMLIICPLSTMVSTWQAEIHRNFHLGSKILHGVDGAARRKALHQPANIYIMNHDGMKVSGMVEALIARTDIDVVVIDEIASFCNAGTARWKALKRIIEHKKYLWGLTGTPIPNSPTDAWAQCRLISPHLVPPYFGRFRDMVLRQVSNLKWVIRDEALDVVQAAMQPSIRYKREECIDLPPVVYETCNVELTGVQKVAYQQMLLQLSAEVDGKIINAVSARAKLTKLLQIACGAVIANATGDDRIAFIPAENRLTLVKEIIEESGGSVIVFVPFRGVLTYVAEDLSKDKDNKGFAVAVIHGGVSKGERDRIFDEFQNKKTIRVLVSIPHAMSHGLNLTAANTIIWFGPIHSNNVYQQANARVSRPGQRRKQLIVNIEGTRAEQLIYKGLLERQRIQDLLLEILSEKLT